MAVDKFGAPGPFADVTAYQGGSGNNFVKAKLPPRLLNNASVLFWFNGAGWANGASASTSSAGLWQVLWWYEPRLARIWHGLPGVSVGFPDIHGDEWLHFEGLICREQMRLYVDGVLQAECARVGALAPSDLYYNKVPVQFASGRYPSV